MTNDAPKRRWLQFRLRTLLITVLVLSLPLSWFARRLERARRQREVVAMIVQEGWGVVLYDWQAEGTATPPYPAWLRGLLGDDFFSSVHMAFFLGTEFGGGGAFMDTDLGDEELAFVSTDFGDEEMACLKSLPDLERLELGSTGITDAGLDGLKGLTNLKRLFLGDTHVTPEGVKKLQEALPNCKIEY